MNTKKIILITVILMIAISSLSMVSAGLFDSGKTKVNGIEFNVDGFKDMGTEGMPAIIVSDGSHVESKSFNDNNGKHLTIRVYDNPNGNISLSNLSFKGVASNNIKPTNETFGGKDGIQIRGSNNIVEFAYIQDGKLVVLQGETSGQSNMVNYEIGSKKVYFSDIIGGK